MSADLPLLDPEERVLTTLEHDGSRRWIYPRLAKGRFLQRRRIVAYALIAIYALLPFITINGKPAILIDIAGREFTFFGFTFLPTDTLLLVVFMLTAVLTLFFATAIAGRVWCGWACPQTVYMEFVFRPIERLFTGSSGKGGQPRKQVAGFRKVLMYLTYFAICLHLSNVFLSYFVGAHNVHQWIWRSAPWEHPGAFMLVAFITGLMMFDFCYWREQLCIIGCPYGRFQSVLLDQSSLIVGYDTSRGEPRGRGRDRQTAGLGDCVDCSMCVAVCPTGIDIRDGLQLECVGCTQCVDACDAVMEKVGKPSGLIRYSSQKSLDGAPTKIVRPRVVVYAGIIMLLATAFVTLLVTKAPFDVSAMRRVGGLAFVKTDAGEIENGYRIIITNRTAGPRTYTIASADQSVRLGEGNATTTVEPRQQTTSQIRLLAAPDLFKGGTYRAILVITDDQGETREQQVTMIGP